MYAQVDNKGNMFHFLLKIMDHKKDGMVINISDGKTTLANGNVKPKITTKGLMLLVMWKDGLTSWVKLKDLKASNPGC
jgi:N-acetylneuraminic acid mutarotase